jgi:RNA polymerase sigma factor (sigma-70 family)
MKGGKMDADEGTMLCRRVADAARGDVAAQDALVRAFQDHAVGYAFALLKDFALAEDAAQEAFLLALRELPRLSEPRAFPAWLRRIVFKCCDRMTRRKRLPTVSLDSAAARAITAPRETYDPVLRMERRHRMAEVRAAVAALPEADRAVATLCCLGGHPPKEVAAFLGLPPATVRKRLQRARARLKERMMTLMEDTLREAAPSRDTRFAESAHLLRRLDALLRGDENVAAAYLAHFGAGEGFGPHDDPWSSINVHVVLKDDRALDALATGRRAFAARLGEPLLWVEAPQNAPPEGGGYYLMTLHDGEAGPYEVDWYWHARSRLPAIPSDTHLLFDRAGLPRSDAPTAWGYTDHRPEALQRVEAARTDAARQAEEGRNTVSAFWAMLMIAAKHVVRDDRGAGGDVPFSGMLRGLLRDTRRLLGVSPEGEEEEAPGDDTNVPGVHARIARLRELAGEMEALMPRVAALGAEVPQAMVPRAHRFLDLASAP